MINNIEGCIHCGSCTEECSFLKKYRLNLSDLSKAELAYSCFLCGECKSVCPAGIDGREISEALRISRVKNGYKPQKHGYGILLAEKKNYIFKNYKRLKSKSVLFPGCNFPAYYPETTKLLSRLLYDKAGITTVFDCCGKPVSELGLLADAEEISVNINNILTKSGTEELIVLCPNCYYYLKPRIHIKITTIYQKLSQLSIGEKLDKTDGAIFIPCPDRNSNKILKDISMSYLYGHIPAVEGIQCCGAGGCASIKEPGLSKGLRREFDKKGYSHIYTYCATCAGMLHKENLYNVKHMLCEILKAPESPSIGIKSLINRASFMFY